MQDQELKFFPRRSRTRAQYSRGKLMVNVVWESADDAEIVAPWATTMDLAMDSPNPAPSLLRCR